MPPIRNLTHRVQRHPSPLVVQTAFQPERLLTPPPMMWNMKFHLEELNSMPNIESCTQGPDGLDQGAHIPKPKGEVTRILRQGYNLYNVLGWKSDIYNEIEVS